MTAPVLPGDFTSEVTTATTTGPIQLGGSSGGSFEVWSYWFSNNNRVSYVINDNSGHWEVGIGTFHTGTPNTISRDYVWWSSASGVTVDFTGLTANVYAAPTSLGANLSVQYHWLGMNSSPTTSSDTTTASDTGSFWILTDAAGGGIFVCVDPTASSAIWYKLLHSVPSGSANPVSNALSGQNNTLNAPSTAAVGRYANAALAGCLVHASQEVSSPSSGQHQFYDVPLSLRTTDNTTTAMVLDGSTSNHLTLPNASAWWAIIDVVAWNSSGNLAAATSFKSLIKRNGSGTPSIVGSTSSALVENDGGASAWTVAAAIDSGNNALIINCTGAAATTISWTGSVRLLQALA